MIIGGNVYRTGRPNTNDINSGREMQCRVTSSGVIACWLLLHIIALQLQMHRNLITTRHDVMYRTAGVEGTDKRVDIPSEFKRVSSDASLHYTVNRLLNIARIDI